ncbi:hypothetical protein CH063_15475 [Colletotrichum higginsianum]|uniref:Uncharacterized protein n=1 Tax=Colletotrichum higginsianum (strain IMI 349063) TaxID=759273 RepID=H1W301_COLHI|nr:hypothetical protein CH063_15475 [Colletotrichum higginsianum]
MVEHNRRIEYNGGASTSITIPSTDFATRDEANTWLAKNWRLSGFLGGALRVTQTSQVPIPQHGQRRRGHGMMQALRGGPYPMNGFGAGHHQVCPTIVSQ